MNAKLWRQRFCWFKKDLGVINFFTKQDRFKEAICEQGKPVKVRSYHFNPFICLSAYLLSVKLFCIYAAHKGDGLFFKSLLYSAYKNSKNFPDSFTPLDCKNNYFADIAEAIYYSTLFSSGGAAASSVLPFILWNANILPVISLFQVCESGISQWF